MPQALHPPLLALLLLAPGLDAAQPAPAYLKRLEALGVRTDPGDPLAARMLLDYGAHFLAQDGVVVPRTWIFKDEAEVQGFQDAVPTGQGRTAGVAVMLQAPAFKAWEAVVADAKRAGRRITPIGDLASRRGYADTEALWLTRLKPGLDHWVARRRLTRAEAQALLALPPREQVEAALRLEAKGLLMSTQRDKTILASVAAPGTSQHLALLAVDIVEHEDAQLRAILARHGWFQTVYGDIHHFTYLGVAEAALPSLGLVRRTWGKRTFWVVPRS